MFGSKEYIYEIYREKSFTTAARKLHISQPALSMSVRKIEERLGAEIFDRSASPLGLTEAGRAYIEAAEQIYAIEENLKNRISDIANLATGSLTVGGTNFVSTCVLPEIFKRFSASYPGIRLELIESSSEQLKEKALGGLIDLVVDYDFDQTQFKVYPIGRERIYLSLSEASSLAERFKDKLLTAEDIRMGREDGFAEIDLCELDGEDFLLMKKGNDMERHSYRILRDAGIRPNVVLRLDQMRTSYELSLGGMGAAFVTDTLIRHTEGRGAVFLRISSPHSTRTLELGHRRNMYVSGSMSKFIEAAEDI